MGSYRLIICEYDRKLRLLMSREGNAVIEARCLEENWPRSLSAFSSSSSRDAPPDTLFFFFFYSNHFLAENGRPLLHERRKTTKGPKGFNETISRYLLDHLSLFLSLGSPISSLSLSRKSTWRSSLPYFLLGNWRF